LVDVSELRIALYIELKSVKVLEMSKDAVGTIIVGDFDLGTTHIGTRYSVKSSLE
jgi:hypothetical protein